jgi:hypothetical protein
MDKSQAETTINLETIQQQIETEIKNIQGNVELIEQHLLKLKKQSIDTLQECKELGDVFLFCSLIEQDLASLISTE